MLHGSLVLSPSTQNPNKTTIRIFSLSSPKQPNDTELQYTPTHSASSIDSRKSTIGPYASITDAQNPPLWRPWSLRTPTLIAFVVLCAVYIAAFEILLQTALKNDGITGIPKWVLDVMPTVATVALGVLWSVVQNDVARLEPYYQLSKPGGATAQESLLVDYQRVLQLKVPFLAFRNRHWAVFLASCSFMIISLGATPMSAAVFSNQKIPISEVYTGVPFTLRPEADQQSSSRIANFAYNAYERVWNGIDLPDYVTDEYSVLGVSTGDWPDLKADDILKFATTRYSASLNCVVRQQKITYHQNSNTTTKEPSRIFLEYKDDNEDNSCEYPLWVRFENGTYWYTLEQLFMGPYPYNAIFQDITSRPENAEQILPPEVIFSAEAPRNATRICGLQGEFDFLAIWKIWPITQDEIRSDDKLSLQRRIQVLGIDYHPLQARLYSFNLLDLLPMYSPGTFTAVMCAPVYTQQKVDVEFSHGKVLNTTAIGDPSPVKGINATIFFETIAGQRRIYHHEGIGTHENRPFENITRARGKYNVLPLHDTQPISRSKWNLHDAENDFLTLTGMPDHSTQMRNDPRFLNYSLAASKLFGLQEDLHYNTHMTPTQSILPFALRMAKIQGLDELADPHKFITALSNAYSMLFSYAMNSEMYLSPEPLYAPNTSARASVATRETTVLAAEVSILFTRLVQAALAVAAVLTAILGLLIHRRPLHVVEEPGAILWHMKSVANCPQLMQDLDGSDLLASGDITGVLDRNSRQYFLSPVNGGIEILNHLQNAKGALQPTLPNQKFETPRYHVPLELNVFLAVGVLVGLVGACGALSAVENVDKRQFGFLMPNKILAQVTLSYLPTVLGMLLEAFILMVTKFVSLVAAYDDMHYGETGIRTLQINYERFPPLFLWFKALGNKHLLLATLSVSPILANALAISSSTIFQQQEVSLQRWEYLQNSISTAGSTQINISAIEGYIKMLRPDYSPQHGEYFIGPGWANEDNLDFGALPHWINKTDESTLPPILTGADGTQRYVADRKNSLELIYAVFNNLTGRGPMRPWTNPTTFFLPLIVPASIGSSDTVRVTSPGLTTSISCSAIPETEILTGNPVFFSGSYYAVADQLAWGPTGFGKLRWYITPNATPTEPCAGAIIHENRYLPLYGAAEKLHPGGKPTWYYETIQPTMRPSCQGNFMLAWIHDVLNNGTFPSPYNSTIPRLIISCSPTLQLVNYSYSIDNKGNILNSSAQLPTVLNLSALASEKEVRNLHTLFQAYISVPWDEESVTIEGISRDKLTWLMYFMYGFIEPENFGSPPVSFPPDPKKAVEAIEKLYPMLFSSFLAVYAHVLFPKPYPNEGRMTATVTSSQVRWRVSVVPLRLTLGLLGFFAVMVALVLWRRPGKFMVHIPNSMATTMVALYAGRWIQDLRIAGLWDGKAGVDVDEESAADELKFGYGWFLGADRKRHVGVDKQPVEKLEIERLGFLERRWKDRKQRRRA